MTFLLDRIPGIEVDEDAIISNVDSLDLLIAENILKSTVYKHVPYAENECNERHNNFLDSYRQVHVLAASGVPLHAYPPHKPKKEFMLVCHECHNPHVDDDRVF